MGRAHAETRRKDRTHRRVRLPSLYEPEEDWSFRKYVVGFGIPLGRNLPAVRNGLGHARKIFSQEWPQAQERMRCRYLPRSTWRQDPRPHLDAEARALPRQSRHSQRISLDCRLLHNPQRKKGGVPPDSTLRVPLMRRINPLNRRML